MKSWMILKSIGGKLRMRMGMYNLFQETITDNILYRLSLKFAAQVNIHSYFFFIYMCGAMLPIIKNNQLAHKQ